MKNKELTVGILNSGLLQSTCYYLLFGALKYLLSAVCPDFLATCNGRDRMGYDVSILPRARTQRTHIFKFWLMVLVEEKQLQNYLFLLHLS